MAGSSQANVTLLFGGINSTQGVSAETWEYAKGDWKDLTPTLTRSPPGEAGANLVYDAADGYFLMFGGGGAYGANVSNQTWKFHNGTWTNLTGTTRTTPPARTGASMFYDATDGYVVLFGGENTSTALGDTWTYVGGAWHDITGGLTQPPPARVYAAATYDVRHGYGLMFGGSDYAAFSTYNDTWRFDRGQWTNATLAKGPIPASSTGATLAYDPTYGYDVMFGGNNNFPWVISSDTWVFANGRWVDVTRLIQSSPSIRFLAGGDFDPTSGAALLFGGCSSVACGTGLNDTYRYDFPLGELGLSPSATSVDVNTSFGLTVQAAGGSFLYAYEYSGLPNGCTGVNSSALTCWPTLPGNFTPSVRVTDTFSPTGGPGANGTTVSPNIQVYPEFRVAAGANRATLEVGQTFWINETLHGGRAPFSFAYGALPPPCKSANVSALSCAPSQPGNFTAIVRVHDTAGGTALFFVPVNVYPRLGLVVNASDPRIELGQTINFTAVPGGGRPALAVSWVGLPAACTVLDSVSIRCLPTVSGFLNVTAQVNDSLGGTRSGWSGPIPVVARVGATATALPIGGPAPLTVAFTVDTTGGLAPFRYWWIFGDGYTSNIGNITHGYQSPGNYTAVVWVNDSAGYSTHRSFAFAVAPFRSAAILASPTTVDIGQNTSLSVSLTSVGLPAGYVWSGLPRGCVSANAPTIECHPVLSGNFTIYVVVTNGSGVSVRGESLLVVLPALTVALSAPGTTSCTCACGPNFAAAFSAIVSGGGFPYRYTWSFGDGALSTDAHPTHVYSTTASTTSRTVTLSLTDSQNETVNASTAISVPSTTCSLGFTVTRAFTASGFYVGFVMVGVVVASAIGVLWLKRRRAGGAPPASSP